MDGDIKSVGGEALGQGNASTPGQIDIKDTVAGIAIKVAVLVHVWAEAGGATFERNLLHQTAPDEGGEAVIDGCH